MKYDFVFFTACLVCIFGSLISWGNGDGVGFQLSLLWFLDGFVTATVFELTCMVLNRNIFFGKDYD